MTCKPLNVAIIGLQHLHPRLYMPLFEKCELTQVKSCVEKDPKLREEFCKEFQIKGFDNLNDLLYSNKPDLAAIFLPHNECLQAAVFLANAGIHLMIEKPVATSSKEIYKIVNTCEKNRVLLTTGYCWRMHPVARTIKELINQGILGTIVAGEGRCAAGRIDRYLEAHSGWILEKQRAGGGALLNLGVHWIDLFRWLFQDEITRVSGQTIKMNSEYDIEDNAFAHLIFSTGILVALDISYTVPKSYPNGRDLYIALRGTKGCLSWAPAFEGKQDVLFVCSDAEEYRGAPIRQITFELEKINGYAGIMGLHYIYDVAHAILDKTSPLITGKDAVKALEVVEAIYRSAKHQRVISIKNSK